MSEGSLPLFLGSVVVLSLSGVIVPGPLLAGFGAWFLYGVVRALGSSPG